VAAPDYGTVAPVFTLGVHGGVPAVAHSVGPCHSLGISSPLAGCLGGRRPVFRRPADTRQFGSWHPLMHSRAGRRLVSGPLQIVHVHRSEKLADDELALLDRAYFGPPVSSTMPTYSWPIWWLLRRPGEPRSPHRSDPPLMWRRCGMIASVGLEISGIRDVLHPDAPRVCQ